MAELIEQARDLKRQARARRESGDTVAAAAALRQGIGALEAAWRSGEPDADGGDGGAAMVAQLADLYGMLGGTLRERGEMPAAAAAYDAGFRFESDPRHTVPSTYNTLNRLVTRVLFRPGCLADPEVLRQEPDLEFVDVPEELVELQERLQQQVAGARAGDLWAAGDLSLTCALNGDEAGMRRGLEHFVRLSPPPEAHDAYRRTVGALARLDTVSSDTIRAAEVAWST